MKTINVAAALGLSVLLAACGGDARVDTVSEEASASVSLTVTSGAALAGSVWICADRVDAQDAPAPADGKYPCRSTVPCTCFPLDANSVTGDGETDGALVNGPSSTAFEGLCPSSNVPEAEWRFTYTLYADESCTSGQELTTANGGSDLVCYDASDLWDRSFPNGSYEYLLPGVNENEIICIKSPDEPEQHVNLGTASAVYAGVTYSDTDLAHYLVSSTPTAYTEPPPGAAVQCIDCATEPDIDLEKLVSVDGGTTYYDADTPTGPTLDPCDPPYFRYEVTNTGNVTLTNVLVTDDVLGAIGTIGSLVPGEITSFTATAQPHQVCP